MLHSPSGQPTAQSYSEISCQVNLKKDCCKGGGWKCCGDNGCEVSSLGCKSYPPPSDNNSGEDME